VEVEFGVVSHDRREGRDGGCAQVKLGAWQRSGEAAEIEAPEEEPARGGADPGADRGAKASKVESSSTRREPGGIRWTGAMDRDAGGSGYVRRRLGPA
jgi:hypothetical protein